MSQKITKAGVYRISIDRYHNDVNLCDGPSVSSSVLRTIFNQSPAHYWCYSPMNPERIVPKEEAHFVLGRACHWCLLGEDAFSTQFIARPEKWDSWRTNDAKAWKADQENAGRTVLLPSQIETIRGMAKALSQNALVQAGLLNGEVERSLIWKDKETGIYLKSRPDCIPTDSGDVADLKTTTDVAYDELSRTIGMLSYHMQAALVGEGFTAVFERPMTSFSLCFIEKEPPYCVRVVTLKDCDLERGRKQNRAALRIFADCVEKGVWPGPGDAEEASFIEIPAWMQTRIDKELEYRGIK